MKTVKISAFSMHGSNGAFSHEATEVQIDEDGRVRHAGTPIGWVRKGTRTYSPPTHRGSRIVRYHKRIDEWQACTEPGRYHLEFRGRGMYGRDTRRAAIAYLIARANGIDRLIAGNAYFS